MGTMVFPLVAMHMRSEATPAAAKAQQQPQKRSLGGTFEGSENRVALNRLVNHDESWLPLNPVANHHVPFQKVSCTGYTIHHFQTKLSIFCRKTLESTFSTWKILQITKNEDTTRIHRLTISKHGRSELFSQQEGCLGCVSCRQKDILSNFFSASSSSRQILCTRGTPKEHLPLESLLHSSTT